ncbi:hypothetical protein BH11BAC3_BH11BAC3_10340 [soil metagenome]
MSNVQELKQYTYRLYLTFLKKHIKANSLLPSSEEEDCVKAFCVLSHAALEEYFEKLSKRTVTNSYKKFKSKSFIGQLPLQQSEVDNLNLLIFQLIKTLVLSSCYSIYSKNKSEALSEHKSKLELVTEIYKSGNSLNVQNVSELTKKTDTYAREVLKETVKFFDHYINENHGASLKYMLKLLIPVGIDIPEDLLLNSLQKLAEYRGTYAHTQGDIIQLMSASDIVKYSIDVVKLCQIIETDISSFDFYIKPVLATPSASSEVTSVGNESQQANELPIVQSDATPNAPQIELPIGLQIEIPMESEFELPNEPQIDLTSELVVELHTDQAIEIPTSPAFEFSNEQSTVVPDVPSEEQGKEQTVDVQINHGTEPSDTPLAS